MNINEILAIARAPEAVRDTQDTPLQQLLRGLRLSSGRDSTPSPRAQDILDQIRRRPGNDKNNT